MCARSQTSQEIDKQLTLIPSSNSVLGTLSDAYNAGWDCIMVEDCCATTTEGAHDVCIHNVTVSLCNHLLLRQ